MPHPSEPPKSSDDAHQTAFRNAAAGLIKTLIRARASQEPDFLTNEDYVHWVVPGISSENRTCAQLLSRVRRLRDRFEHRFLESQDSIPDPASAEKANAFDSLVELVAGFISGDLDKAIRDATEGKKIKWGQLADWKSLKNVRNALDRLPASSAATATGKQPTAQSKKVTLFGLRDFPSVNNNDKPLLGSAQYKLIKKLISAGEDGCTKSQLERVSTNYWKSLSALKKSDKDWDSVIHFPGKSHRGYWID